MDCILNYDILTVDINLIDINGQPISKEKEVFINDLMSRNLDHSLIILEKKVNGRYIIRQGMLRLTEAKNIGITCLEAVVIYDEYSKKPILH